MRTGGYVVFFLLFVVTVHSDCISDPTPPDCSDYQYPATSNVTTLCHQMPHMPGCTLYRLCSTTDPVSQTDFCQPFSILTEICLLDMPRMKGCHVYNSLCPNNTSVKQCHLTPSKLLNIPNTKLSNDSIQSMCDQMTKMPGCNQRYDKQLDFLTVYSKLCIDMPDMSDCAPWKQMCQKIPSSSLCQDAQYDECIMKPQEQKCSNYQYPDSSARDNVTSLCSEMPKMTGCSLNNICHKGNADVMKSKYCDSFSILTEICDKDGMMNMTGCEGYKFMCQEQSTVTSCHLTSDKLLTIPSTETAKESIADICNEMNMDGCSKCKNKQCDYLTVYSDLCISMPDMHQCTSWKEMCKYIPNWTLCSINSESEAVQMRMYFHTDYYDYILFKQWVPRTDLQYAGSLFAVFLASLLYEFIKLVRAIMERRWMNNHGYVNVQDNTGAIPPFRLHVDVPRALLQFTEVLWGLFVMLIAMTYNVGLVLAIGFGAFVGTLLFGRYIRYENKPNTACH